MAIGGSYPGALAAWVRAKYPHLIDGAVASSAVIEAVDDFYMYDRQIFLAMERSQGTCVEKLTSLMEWLDHIYETDLDLFNKVKADLGEEKTHPGDYL